MRFVRARHLFLTAAAMLSLFVSAVAACACSHHEPVKRAVESSCHGPSHLAPATERSNLPAPHFETDCNCFARTPAPAIVAKMDDKRTTVEQQAVDVLPAFGTIALLLDPTDDIEPSFQPPQSNYQHALRASLPSRAPPQL